MARTPLFDRLARAAGIAWYCERRKISTAEGLERVAEAEAKEAARRLSRREILAGAGKVAAAAALAPLAGATAARAAVGLDVGIVGAGLAGLSCTDRLAKVGTSATLYEGGSRAGGRCWSLSQAATGTGGVFFPNQVCERGGEFIDNLHKTMLGYANQFGLHREDLFDNPGEVFYHVNGSLYPESYIVELYRKFVQVIQDDLRLSSGAPTFEAFNDHDELLDNTSIADYFDGQNSADVAADPILKLALEEAYRGEYGLDCEEQSVLNFILFIKASRRSKLALFGVASNERFHIIKGNGKIADGLAQLYSAQIQKGMRLVRVRKTSAGKIEFTFKDGTKTVTPPAHDFGVITIPFSVLRGVELDASLEIPAEQLTCINELGYGTNVKTMIGFNQRPWAAQGSQGTVYVAGNPNVQIMFETNPIVPNSAANPLTASAIWTDYRSGAQGRDLNKLKLQTQVARTLAALDQAVFPGAGIQAAASLNASGGYVAHRQHWPSDPLSKGSYTCYKVGQFTKFEGLIGKPVGNLFFAGEHANSFHIWQGFMEGACLSGFDAANAILK